MGCLGLANLSAAMRIATIAQRLSGLLRDDIEKK
jgi:hypothetical protein